MLALESKARVSVRGKSYYVAHGKKFDSERDEIYSDILGDDIEDKLDISTKMKHQRDTNVSKFNAYKEYSRVDSIDKVFNELNKRLSMNSQQVMANYRVPDHPILADADQNIDLKLEPQPLQPSYKLDFAKTDFFKDNEREAKKIDNQLVKDAERRIKNLIDGFPKAKTNTALLQYAHKLSKECMRNELLEKKRQEFMARNAALSRALDLNKGSKIQNEQQTNGLNISLKHKYNSDYTPAKNMQSIDGGLQEAGDFAGKNTEVKTVEVEVKSRVASLCFDDSKCGTVKIGPARQSLLEGPAHITSTLPSKSSQYKLSIQSIHSNASKANTVACDMGLIGRSSVAVSKKSPVRATSLTTISERQLKYGPDIHKLRGSQTNLPISATSTGSFDSYTSNKYISQQSRALRYSQLCLANEKLRRRQQQQQPAAEVNDSISFLKTSLNAYDPIARLSRPISTATIPIEPKAKPDAQLKLNTKSIVSTPATSVSSTDASTPTSLVTPVSLTLDTPASSIASPKQETIKINAVKSAINTAPKQKSKLSNSISANDIYEDMSVCELETASMQSINTPGLLSPIAELNSTAEKRKSTAAEKRRSIIVQNTDAQIVKAAVDSTKVDQKGFGETTEGNTDAFSVSDDNDADYADINSYESLIDLLTVESIAGTIEHKDFLKFDNNDIVSKKSKATICKNSALGIIVEKNENSSDEYDSDTDLNSTYSTGSSPSTVASDFPSDELSEIESQVDFRSLLDNQSVSTRREFLKTQLKNQLKRSTMMSCFTEYNILTDEDIELVFDDEKFNQDFVTFSRKRQSFDIFETYLLALARLKVTS